MEVAVDTVPGKRMMSLAIGISAADPLPFLRGALNGARDFHLWAKSIGYQSELLTDESDPVTIESLSAKLQSMLSSSPDPIFRLILYFAGHGVIREAEEGLWLLSDWNKQLRAVALEVLKRRLFMYGIQQIAIFADACRSLPADMNVADLTADGVLGRGPVQPKTVPYIDKFIAAQDGATAFMVPGDSPAQDRCLFTGVLMEGLWGSPAAISTFFPGKVTSQSLGQYLLAEVPKRAQTYQRTLNPVVQPLFPLGSDVYFGETQPPPQPPLFSPWPSPSQILGLGPPAPQAAPAPSQSASTLAGLVSGMAISDATSRLASYAAAFKPGNLIANWAKSGAPAQPPPSPKPMDPGHVLQAKITRQQFPSHLEIGAGLALEGGAIRAIWTEPNCFAVPAGRPDWWRIGEGEQMHLDRPTPTLIEMCDGYFLAFTALPHFIASFVCDDRGAQAVIYREVDPDPYFTNSGGRAAKAIGLMESGSLRAHSISGLAVELLQSRHVDPTLGVISAYLLDSVGDTENIRRMAWFYVQNQQTIPFDIALLAQMESGRSSSGLLQVTIPAMPARQPRNQFEQDTPWTCSPVDETQGFVSGFCPWMRQGWAFLDDPVDVETGLILPGITALRSQLTSARFTTFTREGAMQFASLLGLAPSSNVPHARC